MYSIDSDIHIAKSITRDTSQLLRQGTRQKFSFDTTWRGVLQVDTIMIWVCMMRQSSAAKVFYEPELKKRPLEKQLVFWTGCLIWRLNPLEAYSLEQEHAPCTIIILSTLNILTVTSCNDVRIVQILYP